MTLHEHTIILAAVLVITFISGYLLCLYNSTDNFTNHGLEEEERVQPRPKPEVEKQ